MFVRQFVLLVLVLVVDKCPRGAHKCSGYSLAISYSERALDDSYQATRWVGVVVVAVDIISVFLVGGCVRGRIYNERAAKQQHKQLNCNTDISPN